jgi:hypothetical protein
VNALYVRLGILCLCACRTSAAFSCADSEQCRVGAMIGTCEPEGFCSFADGSCPSGSRFDSSAGDGFSNMCVPPVGPGIDAPVQITTCFDAWLARVVRFDAATPLIATSQYERDPFERDDQLQLFFSAKYAGSPDIYVKSRATPTDAYGASTLVMGLSSPASEGKFSFTTDGLYLTLSTNGGGVGGSDVWESSRTSTANMFGMLEQDNLAAVNTPNDEFDAIVSGDGLHLYLAPAVPAPQHLVMASRATTTSAWGTPALISELGSATIDADPAPSPDERLLVFSSYRPGSLAGSNLWYTVRASKSLPWGPPQPVPDLNTDDDEGDPAMSSDGCTLYYSHNAPAAPNFDIWTARQVGF